MNKPKVIGLTGPTGAGKSTVSKILKKQRLRIINADSVAHNVLKYDKKCINLLVKNFSNNILLHNGSIDRSKLASIAFSSNIKTSLLNSITHPFIVSKIKVMLEEEFQKESTTAIVIDAPLLIESNLDKICDCVWSVIAPRNVRIERIISRDKITLEQALKRINAQRSDAFYQNNSDIVIDGSSSLEYLESHILKILEQY